MEYAPLPYGWKRDELGKLVSFASGRTPSKDQIEYWNGDIPWVTARDMKTFELTSSELKITTAGLGRGGRTVPPNSILVLVRGMTLLKDVPVCLAAREMAFNQDVRGLQVKGTVDPRFLAYALVAQKEHLRGLVNIAGHGTGRLSTEALSEHPIIYPVASEEQKAIAAVLSAWDRAIAQTTALIAAKERLKQGMMQQLLTGQRRFPQFRKHQLQSIPLGEIFTKVAKSVDVEPEGLYREIGIRSHGKGIFHKEPVAGKVLGDKRVFHVVPGCLTLNIVFAWERALAVTSGNEAGMIASHRFPMFRPDSNRVDVEFVLHYMLSDVGHNFLKLASPGGAGRNRTISQEQFLKTKIPLPPIVEQQRIVEVINVAEKEIGTLRQKLKSLKDQKRGLMQKLLKGEVRVPKSLLREGAKR